MELEQRCGAHWTRIGVGVGFGFGVRLTGQQQANERTCGVQQSVARAPQASTHTASSEGSSRQPALAGDVVGGSRQLGFGLSFDFGG